MSGGPQPTLVVFFFYTTVRCLLTRTRTVFPLKFSGHSDIITYNMAGERIAVYP